jgi:hypothetical protein
MFGKLFTLWSFSLFSSLAAFCFLLPQNAQICSQYHILEKAYTLETIHLITTISAKEIKKINWKKIK